MVAVARRVAAGRGGRRAAGVGPPAGRGVVGAPDPVVPDDVHDAEATGVGRDVALGIGGGQPVDHRVAPGPALGGPDVGHPVHRATVVVLGRRQPVRAARAREPGGRPRVRRPEQRTELEAARLVLRVAGHRRDVRRQPLQGDRQPGRRRRHGRRRRSDQSRRDGRRHGRRRGGGGHRGLAERGGQHHGDAGTGEHGTGWSGHGGALAQTHGASFGQVGPATTPYRPAPVGPEWLTRTARRHGTLASAPASPPRGPCGVGGRPT